MSLMGLMGRICIIVKGKKQLDAFLPGNPHLIADGLPSRIRTTG